MLVVMIALVRSVLARNIARQMTRVRWSAPAAGTDQSATPHEPRFNRQCRRLISKEITNFQKWKIPTRSVTLQHDL
jgi:hypothetical protein